MIDSSRDWDIVLVRSMDRLGEPRRLCTIVRQLTDKKVRVRFVKENLTCIGDDTAHFWLPNGSAVRGEHPSPERAWSRARVGVRVVVMSMRVMSAGRGYEYLLKSVLAGDGDRDLGTPLIGYRTEAGTAPGTWYARGLPGLSSS